MATPTELLIARHGEAHCNVQQIVGGPIGCTGLTDHGRTQVQQLATRLRREHTQRAIEALYTTSLRRVQESAEIVGVALNLPPLEEPDLTEASYGIADGQKWTDVIEAFDGIPACEPHRPVAAGAETWANYLDRAISALHRLLDRHQGRRIAVVGHGETVVAAAHLFLDLPAEATATAGFAAHPASLTRWAQEPVSWVRPDAGWRWTLVQLNDTAHLI